MPYNGQFKSGNIYIRKWIMTGGENIETHEHNFDHTTMVFTGSVIATTKTISGDVVEQRIDAPGHLLIKKGVKHKFLALSDDTQLWCLFSHRDDQGEVTQECRCFSEPYR